jgi:drug/metabolite transporter (DMT)-like permease
VLYPFTAAQYVWVALIANGLLGEKINAWKKAGIFLIVAGVVLVGLGS